MGQRFCGENGGQAIVFALPAIPVCLCHQAAEVIDAADESPGMEKA